MNATGFVSLKQAGSTVYVAVENGVATYVATFASGSYNVVATYLGDEDYNENTTDVSFTVVEVAKKNTPISLDVSSVENNVTFTVSVNPDATGIVRFVVSGAEEYTVYADVLNGKAVMDDVLSVGQLVIILSLQPIWVMRDSIPILLQKVSLLRVMSKRTLQSALKLK